MEANPSDWRTTLIFLSPILTPVVQQELTTPVAEQSSLRGTAGQATSFSHYNLTQKGLRSPRKAPAMRLMLPHRTSFSHSARRTRLPCLRIGGRQGAPM